MLNKLPGLDSLGKRSAHESSDCTVANQKKFYLVYKYSGNF